MPSVCLLEEDVEKGKGAAFVIPCSHLVWNMRDSGGLSKGQREGRGKKDARGKAHQAEDSGH